MGQAKHTPLPWEIEQGTSFIVARTGPRHAIAECWGDELSNIQANAELIVRACNTHAELVEACKAAEPALWLFIEITKGKPLGTDAVKIHQQLRAAIAPGEKEQT